MLNAVLKAWGTELVEVDSTVGKFAEGSRLLLLYIPIHISLHVPSSIPCLSVDSYQRPRRRPRASISHLWFRRARGKRAHIFGVSHACCFSRARVYGLVSRAQVKSVGRWLRIVLHQTSKNSGLHMCEHFRLVRGRDCGRANALISLGAIFHHIISLGNILSSPRSKRYSGGKITLLNFTKISTYFHP